jgi:hypothetical protein
VPALQSETEAFSKAIKGVKSRARALMQQQGLTAKVAQKIAAKAVTGKRGYLQALFVVLLPQGEVYLRCVL